MTVIRPLMSLAAQAKLSHRAILCAGEVSWRGDQCWPVHAATRPPRGAYMGSLAVCCRTISQRYRLADWVRISFSVIFLARVRRTEMGLALPLHPDLWDQRTRSKRRHRKAYGTSRVPGLWMTNAGLPRAPTRRLRMTDAVSGSTTTAAPINGDSLPSY